jgi:hypothetical protein
MLLPFKQTRGCVAWHQIAIMFRTGLKYNNPSVYNQLVYGFSLVQDAQINTCFSIYEPIFSYTSSFLLQTDRCSRWEWEINFRFMSFRLMSSLGGTNEARKLRDYCISTAN